MKKQIKQVRDNNKIAEEFKSVSVSVNGKNNFVDIYNNMFLRNPHNPAEVVEKMNNAVPYYGFLGAMKADLEHKLAEIQDDFNLWFSSKVGEYEGLKSEKAKENAVMADYQEDYSKRLQEIRDAKHILRQVDIARKSYDKHISLIQSIGSMLRAEMEKPEPEKYDIKEKKKGSGSLEDF